MRLTSVAYSAKASRTSSSDLQTPDPRQVVHCLPRRCEEYSLGLNLGGEHFSLILHLRSAGCTFARATRPLREPQVDLIPEVGFLPRVRAKSLVEDVAIIVEFDS